MATSLRILVASLGLLTGTALAGLTLGGVPSALAAEPAAPARLITQADVIGITVKQSLIASAKAGSGPFDIATAEAIETFYDQHGNQPVWVGAAGYNDKARQVIAELKRASDWGLSPSDYAVSDIGSSGLTNAKLADGELALTRAALRYAHDAHVGRFDPQKISEMIDLMSTPPNATAVLAGLSDATDPAGLLASYNPHHAEFEWLRQKYLALRGNGGDSAQVRIPDGPRLKPGDSSADIPLIRSRLHSVAPAGTDPQVYDDALAGAVKAFEDRYGYRADGIITTNVRRLLNQPAQQNLPGKDQQIEKILANMERWRWLPEDMGTTYIFDNIPEFVTRVIKDGQVIHQAKIVVGKPDTATPIFSNSMKYVEFHPYWHLPESIKMKEIVPAVLSGGVGILARRGLKVQINGKDVNPNSLSGIDIRNYDISQPPGPGNALGDVKFMFPNHYDVYMHDTPSKDLFAENVRAFSHGCMRVQDPRKFANVIMEQGSGWSVDQVNAQFADPNNQQVPLDHAIPVHVTYFTVRPTADGQVAFIDDIYGHDRRVTLAIAGKWGQISKQLAPKSTLDPALIAGLSYRGNGGIGSGTFTDIFGNSSRPSRHHNNSFFLFGDSSGFTAAPPATRHRSSGGGGSGGGGGFFGGLFGF